MPLCEDHDGHRRELLRQGCEVAGRRRRKRYSVLEVRGPESVFIEDPSIFRNQNASAELPSPRESAHQRIDLCRLVAAEAGHGERPAKKDEGYRRAPHATRSPSRWEP